ncbi:MAG TPA: class I SAM-dependent methyltransferase [Candidatus Angelobacter sp.]
MADQVTRTIREDYDKLAKEYARQIYDELRYKPLDRALLNRFADAVKGRGDVYDMGCGPGQVARYLHERGVSVFGLDLSSGMLEQARELNPDIFFREGDMLALDLPQESLAGIAAFYAIVNIPARYHRAVFEQMIKVLKPDGLLLLAFHAGNEIIEEKELWGHKISMNFLLLQPDDIRRDLEAAGFAIEEIVQRGPYPEVEYPSRRAYIFARKALPEREPPEYSVG